MKTESEVLADLQCVIEEGERGDWNAYALRRPHGAGHSRRTAAVAALLADARLPGLRLRGALLAIDADPRVMERAIRAEELEERDVDPAHVLVEVRRNCSPA
jgi:hypothetical protein